MRMMVVVLVSLVCMPAFGQEAELTAKIVKSGRGWVLAGQDSKEAAKVAAEVRKARRGLEALRSQLVGKQYDQGRLADMEKKIAGLEARLSGLVDGLSKVPVAVPAKADTKALDALAKRVAASEKALKSLPNPTAPRKIHLDVSGFGGGAIHYDHTAGAAFGIHIPLGNGIWGSTTRFGLGIGATNGVGIVATTSVTASLGGGRFSIGPAAVAEADFDNLKIGVWNFVLGGGFDATLNIWKGLFLSALPFVGVTQVRGSVWVEPTYATTPCGFNIETAAGHWTQGSGKSNAFTAGVVGNLGFRFF
jgi:hypothetical protein